MEKNRFPVFQIDLIKDNEFQENSLGCLETGGFNVPQNSSLELG